MMRTGANRVALTISAVALASTACTTVDAPGTQPPTATQQSKVTLPPRPQDVSLQEVDPCDLLTAAQRDELGVGRGREGTATHEGFNSPSCIWTRFPEEPRDSYLIELIQQRGAEYALDSSTGVNIVQVEGFPAVETRRGGNYPNESHCVLLVDVAENQSLWIQYDYEGSTIPTDREMACEKARNTAGMAVQTLRKPAGG
jgi:hypothetical protein